MSPFSLPYNPSSEQLAAPANQSKAHSKQSHDRTAYLEWIEQVFQSLAIRQNLLLDGNLDC